jgi:hypothetical protein
MSVRYSGLFNIKEKKLLLKYLNKAVNVQFYQLDMDPHLLTEILFQIPDPVSQRNEDLYRSRFILHSAILFSLFGR